MIVFLTLIYVAILFVAVKIGIVRWNAFWKISPVLWMVLLFFVLFVPMQWGAPSGPVRMYQAVVEVIPNVTGEVAEITAKPLVHLDEGTPIFRIDPTQYEAAVDRLEAQVALARANLARAEDLMQRGVGRQLDVDLYQAEVASYEAQLADAQWQLEHTVVLAPSDGMVVGLSLRKGQRVANLPLRSWVSFVEEDSRRMMVGIPQSRLRFVEPGQKAEVVLRLYPGQTFSATVRSVANINPDAQLAPSGLVPPAPLPSDPTLPYGVILELDDKSVELDRVHGGAMGTAAIYTDSVAATHIIRRVMIRMEAWMNYIKP